MNIAIIGGGFTGLTAAYELTKKGHKVTLFEKEKYLGGLAHGFTRPGWDWHLESAYHHLFTNDTAIVSLIKELGLTDKLIVNRPITATLYQNAMFPLDSPIHLLRFPGIPIIDRVRTGILLAFLKVNPFWQPLESFTAKQLFLAIGGKRAWETIWEPLMIGKFDTYADSVAASWLWARIKKRTQNLCYIKGGFHTLVTALEQAIKKQGGIIVHKRFNPAKAGLNLKKIDRTLLTIHTPTTIPHLHAQTLILETKEPILKNAYWLNITDRSFPFLAVVAHTNMVDKKYYGGHHLTYFGNYLPSGHPYLSMTKDQLLHVFTPHITRLNPSCLLSLVSCRLYTAPFAQPVHELHYSARAPKLKTSIPGLYLANMDSIFPWDRGTNYAIELGIKAAKVIHEKG